MDRTLLLVKPPFCSPITPPMGISVLKSFLQQHGYSVKCVDLNMDPALWQTHHEYFAALQTLETLSVNDGYSKLWDILSAHMLAHVNGADATQCRELLETIIPVHEVRWNGTVVEALVSLVERYFGRLNELIDGFALGNSSVVGTSTYSTSLASSLHVLRRVKQRQPGVTTLMGGGAFYDDLAQGSENLEVLLDQYPCVDHVVLGEGERVLLEILRNGPPDKRVLSHVDVGGTLAIDDVPAPDFSDLDVDGYGYLGIEGGRSCPFQCEFCSETVQWGAYRKRKAKLLAQQMIDASERYCNNLVFMSDSLMNPYIMDLSAELLERRADISYDGYLRADRMAGERERVEEWARSGLCRVRLGVESGSASVLKAMNKKTTPETISRALSTLAGAGIRTTTYWIVGFPGESEADFQDTLEFVKQHHRDIYELETHTYRYYPQGQVGSGSRDCRPLYPDHVTDAIRFKSWETAHCAPERAERFRRLRRITSLASELGLPNAYTLEDRFLAESRWQGLHERAVDVY